MIRLHHKEIMLPWSLEDRQPSEPQGHIEILIPRPKVFLSWHWDIEKADGSHFECWQPWRIPLDPIPCWRGSHLICWVLRRIPFLRCFKLIILKVKQHRPPRMGSTTFPTTSRALGSVVLGFYGGWGFDAPGFYGGWGRVNMTRARAVFSFRTPSN